MTDRRPRRWLQWLPLVPMVLVTFGAFFVSSKLHEHAEHRHAIAERVGEIETLSVAQSGIVWQAFTRVQMEGHLGLAVVRGEEQRGREEIYARLAELEDLEAERSDVDARLGYAPIPEWSEELEAAAGRFLGGVQGALSQMSMQPEMLKRRLQHWDMNYGAFQEALTRVQERDNEIAASSAALAQKVNRTKALITLVATILFVLRVSQIRRGRERAVQEARVQAIAKSEARFREIVQNSSDVILVTEASGDVRYATPSARVFAESLDHTARGEGSEDAHSGARALEAAIEAGAFAGTVERSSASVTHLLGLDLEAVTSGGNAVELELEDASGERRVYDVQARDLTGHPDVAGIVVNAREVTERKTLEEKLRHQALHDPLTELPNRRRFEDHFDGLSDGSRAGASVLFVDLDGFKLVNDSYGHGAGDELLCAVAHRIGSCLRFGDLLARQGGDEFLILFTGDVLPFAESIQEVLRAPFLVDGNEVFVTASLGIVRGLEGLSASEATQRADIAMYEAKREGKDRAIVFADEMASNAPERLALERDFRRALERREFSVVYQPKVGLKSGRTESLEALVRWNSPERGFVGPDLFIPFAEETGLVNELGQQILERACLDAVRWQDEGVVVAVNVSPIQFRNPRLVDEVREALELSGLRPSSLELEITESAVLGDIGNTIRVLDQLKAIGVRLAIDDFGTGYSNLAHLKHFQVDVLKIDQAFVRGGSLDELSDEAIVEAVVGMAKAFEMKVVAEGVESEAHADALRAVGVDLGQGYFFSKPVDAAAIDARLKGERVAA